MTFPSACSAARVSGEDGVLVFDQSRFIHPQPALMLLRLENAERITRWTVQEIQRSVVKHKEFLESLEHDSDWAFSVKIHAFLEALVTSLIATYSGNFRLGALASRLPMSSSDGLSKLELVKENNLMSPERIKFIKKIGEIRNKLAHDIKMIEGFKFPDYIKSLDNNQLGQWKRCLSCSLSMSEHEDAEDYFNLAETNPRDVIYLGLVDVVCTIEGDKVTFNAHSMCEDNARVDTMAALESYQSELGNECQERSHTFSIELDEVF
jgi:hypothetical protein